MLKLPEMHSRDITILNGLVTVVYMTASALLQFVSVLFYAQVVTQ